jgi:hypothetical protein
MKSKLILATALILSNISAAWGANEPVKTSFSPVAGPNETYLGAIHYQGGLLERGTLTLSQAMELKYIRFEIPNFCKPEIFEAGTVTEGIADLAQATDTPNLFAVNGGRGLRARSIFLSLNGPDNSSCHILVFSKSTTTEPAPEPNPGDGSRSAKSITCIVNDLNVPFIGRLITDGTPSDFSSPARTTSALITTLRADRTSPTVQFAFDADLSPGYIPQTVTLVSLIQEQPDCRTAPVYAIRQRPFSSLVDFVRVQ